MTVPRIVKEAEPSVTSDQDLDVLTSLISDLAHIRRTVDRIADALGITQREHGDDYRSSVSGRYVSADEATQHPDTTVHENG